MVAGRKGAVRGVGLTILDLPVGDELRDGALSSLGLIINIPITVPLERNGTKRTGDEINHNVDEAKLLARFIRREDLVEILSIRDEIIAPERRTYPPCCSKDGDCLFL